MVDKGLVCCSFCGVEKTTEIPLISGNDGRICEACVKLAHQVVASWGGAKKAARLAPKLRTPEAIKKHLNDYVVGQDMAKETLAIAVYNHYLRLMNSGMSGGMSGGSSLGDDGGDVELEKSNVLLVGPSGTGKTLIVRSLAKILGVPFISADATSLTQAGYVGDDVDSIIVRLLDAADGDVAAAEWGIVYIDEIDKIAKRGGGATNVRDVSGEGVQQGLLKLVEGSELKVSKAGKRRDSSEEVFVNTRNVLFIVGGAFPGLEELVSGRVSPKGARIGFHSVPELEKPSINELMENLLPDDLQGFGLIPEFIGRFPITTFLQALDVDALLEILNEPKNALVKQYRQLFSYQGVSLNFTEEALKFIAQEAISRNTGARGLRSVLEAALHKTMFEMPSTPELRECTLRLDNSSTPASLYVQKVVDDINESQLNVDKNGGEVKAEVG